MLAHMIYIAVALLLLQTVNHPVDSTAKDVSPPKLATKTDPELLKLNFSCHLAARLQAADRKR